MSAKRKRVGVRELRQNLSVYLRRVAAGEALEVTERGRPVGLLVPLPEGSTPLERLTAQGRMRRPVGDLVKLGLPRKKRSAACISEALREIREERL